MPVLKQISGAGARTVLPLFHLETDGLSKKLPLKRYARICVLGQGNEELNRPIDIFVFPLKQKPSLSLMPRELQWAKQRLIICWEGLCMQGCAESPSAGHGTQIRLLSACVFIREEPKNIFP